MDKAKPIDVELVRTLLEYAPELGGSCLRWKVSRQNNAIKKGSMAGGLHPAGYWLVRVGSWRYLAHRLVWAVVYGEDPVCQIDHIGGREAGNHIENLRLAPRNHLDNGQNRKVNKNNTSGYTGVSRKGEKWLAQIMANGVQNFLGTFDTTEEAHAAYLKAKNELHTFGSLCKVVFGHLPHVARHS